MKASQHLKTLQQVTIGLVGCWVVALVVTFLCPFPSLLAEAGGETKGAAPEIRFISWGGIGGWNLKMAKAASIGIDTHRIPIGWTDADGQRDYTEVERAIRCISEAGMNVISALLQSWRTGLVQKGSPRSRPAQRGGKDLVGFRAFILVSLHPTLHRAQRHLLSAVFEGAGTSGEGGGYRNRCADGRATFLYVG